MKVAKNILKKYIEEKIISEQTTMLTAFEKWFNFIQYIRSEETKLEGAIEYYTKLTLYKSFTSWSKTARTNVLAKQV